MWDEDMSYQQITDYPNENDYRTPTVLRYTYSNVVMTLQKYFKRLERIRSEDSMTFREFLCVQSITILPDQ